MSENTEVQMIRYRLLRFDHTQHRLKLDDEAINDYVAAINREEELPPIQLVSDGTFYWVVDGHHRAAAYLKARDERIEIPCVVAQGTHEDAQWLSLSANKSHGVRRTNADKRNAVIFARHPKFRAKSDRVIGEHIGVDHKTVGRWRKELASGEIPRERSAKDSLEKAFDAIKRITGVECKEYLRREADGTERFVIEAAIPVHEEPVASAEIEVAA